MTKIASVVPQSSIVASVKSITIFLVKADREALFRVSKLSKKKKKKQKKSDKFFHPVVLYENHLICIFMNIYENSKNDGKIIGKKKVSNDQELGPWG